MAKTIRAYELQPREGFDALTLVERPAPVLGPTETIASE